MEGALGLGADSNGVAHIAFKAASTLTVQRFNGVSWLFAYVAEAPAAIISLDLALDPADQPLAAVATSASVLLYGG